MALRSGNKAWAEVDSDDEEDVAVGLAENAKFENAPDKDGIKTVVEYAERNTQTYKITKRVKVTTVVTRTNQNIQARKNMKKFGKSLTDSENARNSCQSPDEFYFELTKKVVQLATKDDAEDKFYDESLKITEGLCKDVKKTTWAEMNAARQTDKDVTTTPVVEEKKPEEPAAGGPPKSTYVPPSLRGKAADGGKGDGKGKGVPDSQDCSLRITNLSEDCREGDLQDLFAQCGRLQRVYLAKDPVTFTSRGFAFVTYYNREDAQKAIDRLHGHGYDNLILQVQFAKPRV